jgi:hypothetical protein
MKKLGILNINPEKLIRDQEQISLRGGYWGNTTYYCKHNGVNLGTVTLSYCSEPDGHAKCLDEYPSTNEMNYSCGY